jgi:hypothetical protein
VRILEADLEVVRSLAEIVRTQLPLEVPHQDSTDFVVLKFAVVANLVAG